VQRRLEFEKTISDISSRFVGASDINNAINVSLRDIGRLSGASRAYLFLFSEDMTKMSNTHEWCADGVTPQIGSLKNLPTNTFPWWMEKLRKGEVIRIDDASKMPEEAKAERKTLLEDQNIKSLLVLPLNMQGELMGFIGFDNVTTTGMWRDEDLALLNISSKIIASALSHERIDEEIKSLARFPSENPNPILRLNKDGIIMLANPASRVFLQDWGCKVGDYAPKFWQDLVTETLTNKSRRTIDAELGDRVYLFFVMPVQEANYVNFYGRDITERKRMEEERSRLAAIVDSSDDAIIGKSLDGIIQTWNSGAERLYGYSTDEAIGQNISILTPPELSNEISEILEKIKSGERIKNYETTRISKDGRRIYVSLTISPIIDRSGKIVGASTIARDITNRRQMEEELRRHSEHLEELVENRTEEIKKLNESMSQRLIQKIRQIDNISSLRDEVRKSPDISTALDLILDAVLSDLEMDIGAVLIAKREENVVKLRSFKSRAEGMKVDEEFPLNVGFAEFEALNENKNLSKIVGRDEPTILKTPSVHCAPIHLGNEVYGILACGSRKNLTLDGSDVDVLRLYSDLASTVFETRRLTITPVKEVGSVTEKRFEFEFGCSYLVKNDVQKAFEAFAENVLSGFEGLCITREFPQRVRNKYQLEKTPIVWLTGEKVEGETTINSLQDLSVLIGNFLEKVDQGVVMLDGFEYLITNNGFDSFIRFLQMTRSRFEQRGAVFMAPLLEEALDVKQVKLIEREMKLLMSK
jgi:PAS domain S-box-containing protein